MPDKLRKVELKVNPVVEGNFHTWGQFDYDSKYSITLGIIELEDGSVVTARPQQIKFI
jgi:hypothetical protein